MASSAPFYRYDVFISYSHADRAWVYDWLLPQIEAAGLRACIDDRDFAIGAPSIVNMEEAVMQSRHTLLILTPAWVKSEWTAFGGENLSKMQVIDDHWVWKDQPLEGCMA